MSKELRQYVSITKHGSMGIKL